MSNKIYIFFGLIVVIGIAFVAFLFFSKKDSTLKQDTFIGTLPVENNLNQGAIGTDPVSGGEKKQMSVASQAIPGGEITTLDFINNGVTVEDVQNPGEYYLAGDVGYCLEDGTCPASAPSDEYVIGYNSKDTAFIIVLKEPLGQAREHAGSFLQETLGITKEKMCELKYYISTTSYINEQYAGKNLLFSFCPGAVVLPN